MYMILNNLKLLEDNNGTLTAKKRKDITLNLELFKATFLSINKRGDDIFKKLKT